MTPANAGIRYPSEHLTRDEVERILARAEHGFTPVSMRNVAALALLWRTGLRIGECLALRAVDYDSKEGALTVLRPKGFALGKRPRVVGVDGIANEHLLRWRAARSNLLLEDTDPLFPTASGGRIATSYFRALLPRLARAAGITRRVHPHMLRHTFAFECAMEGRPLPWISAALGHTSLVVTQQYLAHLAPAEIVSGMRERA